MKIFSIFSALTLTAVASQDDASLLQHKQVKKVSWPKTFTYQTNKRTIHKTFESCSDIKFPKKKGTKRLEAFKDFCVESGCDVVDETCAEPAPQCGPVCMIFCEHGNVMDEAGCPTCQCKPKPKPCGPLCRMFCEHGNVEDENGCPTCECKKPPTCGPVCKIYCKYGNVMVDGCPTCECKEQEPEVLARSIAPVKDDPVIEPECGPVCSIWCEHGNVLDARGCPTCECNPPPHTCGPVCAIFCQYGNVLDEYGCPTCQCNKGPVSPVSLD